jgi:hypothetical protein
LDPKILSEAKFQNNKYSKWYWGIIVRAANRELNVQTELHHILPKGKLMFPEYRSLKENPWNGVYLTLREHYLCHLLLTKMTIGEARRSAVYGLMRFSSGIEKCNSHRYEKAKALFRKARKGCPNPLKGKPGRKWTEAEKNKHSARMKDAMSNPETKAKCSAAKIGKPGALLSEQHKAAISYAQRNLSAEQRANKSNAKLGNKNGVFGKYWVTNGKSSHLISKEDLPPLGFYSGRMVKPKL